MSKKLTALFDYQKFEGNRNLQQVIDSTKAKYGARELNPDEMDRVAAAGTIEIPDKKTGKEK